MTSERKEPHLTDLDPAGRQERIPTLSERVAPDLFDELEDSPPADEPLQEEEPVLSDNLADALDDDTATTPQLDDYDFIEELTREDSEPEPAGEKMNAPETEAAIRPEDIEALSDRVLDQIAPALREAVAAAVTELLAKRSNDTD